MKIFEKYFEGKILYKDIDKFVNSIQIKLDPDDEIVVEFSTQENLQFISVNFLDRVSHWWKMVRDKYVITDELTFGEVKKIYEIIKSKYVENTYTINWNNHNDECRFTTDITKEDIMKNFKIDEETFQSKIIVL